MTSFTRKCRSCKGGKLFGETCADCGGTGYKLRPISVRTQLDPRLTRKEAGDISVTLYPDMSIGFRKLKRRREVRLPLSSVYSMALKADAKMLLAEKQAKKQGRRR